MGKKNPFIQKSIQIGQLTNHCTRSLVAPGEFNRYLEYIMDTVDYKSFCAQPDVFSRGMLEATERVLASEHPPSASRLKQVLNSAIVPKPKKHSDDDHTDFFQVNLNTAEAEQIVEYLLDLEAEAVGPDGETTVETSRLSDLVNAWEAYVDFCDRKTS